MNKYMSCKLQLLWVLMRTRQCFYVNKQTYKLDEDKFKNVISRQNKNIYYINCFTYS